jgi:phospholipase C
MGIRVPMIVISPWSKGGWVNSQVFDHSSLIRFIERRFGCQYPGIVDLRIQFYVTERRNGDLAEYSCLHSA